MERRAAGMKKSAELFQDICRCYIGKQIPLASAALSYYLTMTFFPLVICLYTLLGKNYERALAILAFLEEFLSRDTIETISSFLHYVADNHSNAMFYAGMLLMLSSASAAVRSMQITIGRMQGGRRYGGILAILFSILFSVVFLLATYFAILVMFSSRDLLEVLNKGIPFLDISRSWHWIKYLILFGLLFLIQWAIFTVSRGKHMRYRTFPGALLSTVGMVAMSMVFARFIAVSARYSLVYGSLASMILLMYWLYLSCQIIYVGAAFNISLRDKKDSKEETNENSG